MNHDKAEETARDQGFDTAYAVARGDAEKQNPFRKSSWLHEAWEGGFQRAAEEIDVRYRHPNS